MDAIGGLIVLGSLACLILGLAFVAAGPKRARFALGLVLLAVGIIGVWLMLVGAGLGAVASH